MRYFVKLHCKYYLTNIHQKKVLKGLLVIEDTLAKLHQTMKKKLFFSNEIHSHVSNLE